MGASGARAAIGQLIVVLLLVPLPPWPQHFDQLHPSSSPPSFLFLTHDLRPTTLRSRLTTVPRIVYLSAYRDP